MKRTDITALFPEATKDQLDKLLDLNGADINAAKGDLETIKGQLSAAQTELDAIKAKPPADKDLAAQLKAVQEELTGLKAANSLRELREKVGKEKGVPADLLTGETEDACKGQADSILAFAKQQPGYPALKDGGEAHEGGSTATREQFASWFNEAMQ